MLALMRENTSVEATEYWQAVLARNHRLDGAFVYAVRSTGIYCRPSCPSRKPRREQVTFYALPELAEQAGYRPCRRCRPDQPVATDPAMGLIREVCRFIEARAEEPLTLETLGARFRVSPHHLQRTFKRIVGVSPQAYRDARRIGSVKTALQGGEDISGALYEAGYGSSSRLYEKAAPYFGMTPGRYKRKGEGMRIRYAITPCPLGQLLVAATGKGICAVRLGDDAAQLEAELQEEFGRAQLEPAGLSLRTWVDAILHHLDGHEPQLELPLDIQATAFQQRVWQALQAIPYGETRSYQEIAQAIGQPEATRAVASACASNPVALVIPCHRVVRKGGELGGYRWGTEKKKRLLACEVMTKQRVNK